MENWLRKGESLRHVHNDPNREQVEATDLTPCGQDILKTKGEPKPRPVNSEFPARLNTGAFLSRTQKCP